MLFVLRSKAFERFGNQVDTALCRLQEKRGEEVVAPLGDGADGVALQVPKCFHE